MISKTVTLSTTPQTLKALLGCQEQHVSSLIIQAPSTNAATAYLNGIFELPKDSTLPIVGPINLSEFTVHGTTSDTLNIIAM